MNYIKVRVIKLVYIYLNMKIYPEYNSMIETMSIINSTEANVNRVKKKLKPILSEITCVMYIVACE